VHASERLIMNRQIAPAAETYRIVVVRIDGRRDVIAEQASCWEVRDTLDGLRFRADCASVELTANLSEDCQDAGAPGREVNRPLLTCPEPKNRNASR
jgi:hypothetical protein